jgi:Tol biopolymer transport system component
MKKPTSMLVAALLMAALQTIGAQQNAAQAEKLLAAAQHKAAVDGDLKGAIEAYKKIVAGAGANRSLAAQALVRMAECYQKLGDAEAQRIYERLVREYGDQQEVAATARARLTGAAAQNAGIITRQVWTRSTESNLSRVSPDGRHIVFTDWATGDLAVHDLSTGRDRRVTNKGSWTDSPEYALFPVIAQDGRHVAYAWVNRDRQGEVRISALNGDTNPPRVVFGPHDAQYVDACDWTPDDKGLAVRVARKDGTVQLGLLSVVDGTLRTLKSVGWGSGCSHVSPDGKYLAYDSPASDEADQSDIYVMALDAAREAPLVVHPANDTVLGWSPDGAYLLFKSDRGGSIGIWALPIADGRSRGEPQLIRANINPASIGITRAGALFYAVNAFKGDVYVASIDFDAGALLAAPKPLAHRYVGTNWNPAWSPDGKHLAYLSHRELPTTFNPILVIESLESGSTRELKPELRVFERQSWSPDGASLVGTGADKRGRVGIYRVDATSGKATLIEPGLQQGRALGAGVTTMGWSRDGTALLIGRMDAASNKETIYARDIQSGAERQFGPDEVPAPNAAPRFLSLSPNGAWRALARVDAGAKSTSLQLRDIHRGTTRELLRVAEPEGLGQIIQWTPDGRFIVFVKTFGGGSSRRELWRVPAEGGTARKIDMPVVGDFLRFHPDGRRVAFAAGEREASEIWVMENFLPASSSKKR